MVIGVAIVGAVSGFLAQREHALPEHPMTRVSPQALQALVGLTLNDLEGQEHALSRWKGQPLVVNFWATWCPPCREELPAFGRLHQEFKEQHVQFVAVSIDDENKVRAFQAENPIPFKVLLGDFDAMAVTRSLGNPAGGLPFTVVLGADGTVRHTRVGLQPEGELRAVIQRILSGA